MTTKHKPYPRCDARYYGPVNIGGGQTEIVEAFCDLEPGHYDRHNSLRICASWVDHDLPHIILLDDIAQIWGPEEQFIETATIITRLVEFNPAMWGRNSYYGKALTAQRMGPMLYHRYGVSSSRMGHSSRGYRISDLALVLHALGIAHPGQRERDVE